MTFFALLGHIAGFLAPAMVLAVLLWTGLRLRRGKRPSLGSVTLDLGFLAGAGSAVLLAGLVYFGRDGKVATYAALVLVQGTLAWWMRGR